jgi:hypothetical protein
MAANDFRCSVVWKTRLSICNTCCSCYGYQSRPYCIMEVNWICRQLCTERPFWRCLHLPTFRNEMDNDNIHHVTISHDSSIWITNLEWSDWRKDGVGKCGLLLYAKKICSVDLILLKIRSCGVPVCGRIRWNSDLPQNQLEKRQDQCNCGTYVVRRRR